jgi:hypothetical protein
MSINKIWYDKSNEIACTIENISKSLKNPGEHFLGIIKLMPGLVGVELIDQGVDFVKIRTNEGIMMRSNIKIQHNSSGLVIEFHEEYQAGKLITTNCNFSQEFIKSETGVNHHIIISNLEAPGFLGFIYKNFSKYSIGKAFLNAYKIYFEQ